jgi:hypothetical protein
MAPGVVCAATGASPKVKATQKAGTNREEKIFVMAPFLLGSTCGKRDFYYWL